MVLGFEFRDWCLGLWDFHNWGSKFRVQGFGLRQF